jgi:hypothetical protein
LQRWGKLRPRAFYIATRQRDYAGVISYSIS